MNYFHTSDLVSHFKRDCRYDSLLRTIKIFKFILKDCGVKCGLNSTG
jgi:hypothetical protein